MEILQSARNRDKDLPYNLASVLVGAMAQNVYLTAASLKLGARYIYGVNRAFISEELKLSKDDSAVCIVLIGKYAI
jgi:hypothetical protein